MLISVSTTASTATGRLNGKLSHEIQQQRKVDEHGKVTIYSDGACSGNPGPGGWGAVIYSKGKYREANGFIGYTTNQKAELTAIIEAFKLIPLRSKVEVYTDSLYVINGTNHLDTWIMFNWRNFNAKPIQNKLMWSALYEVIKDHEVKWFHVKGHADNALNNRADELARLAISREVSVI